MAASVDNTSAGTSQALENRWKNGFSSAAGSPISSAPWPM